MIKDDPQRKYMRWILLPLVIDICLFSLLVLSQFFSSHHQTLSPFFLVLLIFDIILLSSVIILFVYARRRTDKHRERAMKGDTSLLAREQPVPDASAVPAPVSIRLNMRWQPLAAFFVILAIFFFIIVIIIPPLTGSVQTLTYISMGIIFGIMLLGLVVGFIVLYVQLKSTPYYAIMISQEGLTTYYTGRVRTVYWHEARVFAITGGRKSGGVQTYELASRQTVARWVFLPRRTWSFYKTEVPYEQYEQQMRALLSYIAARTGLPLYDLRNRPAKKD